MGRKQQRLNKVVRPKLDSRIADYIQKQLDTDPNFDGDKKTVLKYVREGPDTFYREYNDLKLANAVERVLATFEKAILERDEESPYEDDSELEVPEGVTMMEVKDTNAMNKSLTSLWNVHKPAPPSTPATPTQTATAPSTPNELDAAAAPDTDVKKAKKRTKSNAQSSDAKRMKAADKTSPVYPTNRMSDLGGIEQHITEVMDLILRPIAQSPLYVHTGVQPPRGILLHGPPGCGKTAFAHAIAGELQVPFLNISAPSVVSGMSGESEKKIREVFEEAKELAPCILFIDEIDAITPKRETAQREMERRIVAQLLTCMDDLSWEKTNYKTVMIIGATNRPDALDPALRRAGRFDREISMGVPDEIGREKILKVLASKLRLSGDFDFKTLARLTPGYVGADLQSLTTAAGNAAIRRISQMLSPGLPVDVNGTAMDVDSDKTIIPASASTIPASLQELRSLAASIKNPPTLTPEQLDMFSITNEDFIGALKHVQPTAKREGFATVPDVTWDEIGALEHVREELRFALVEPIKDPELYAWVGIKNAVGVLLWGPPGCGKTLLAKAVANESHTNFISVKGPELLNKYVGESERAVRQVFIRARASSPCVIFFDELDALCGRRDDAQSDASARVVNTLLTELDGVESRAQVYVIAATNRPDMIDPAMLRPGRLDKLLYVELPTAAERLDILRKVMSSRHVPLDPTCRLEDIAVDERCQGFSGADLQSLVREVGVAALREALSKKTPKEEIVIRRYHFDLAFERVGPSVSKQDREAYDALRSQFGSHTLPSPHHHA